MNFVRWWRAGIAIALFAGIRTAGAQVVRGTVTMPDGTTRAAGVIVVAVRDSTQPARALTSQRGAFSIRVPNPGRYSIRVLRIGFRPTEGPIVTVGATDTISIQLTITDVAVSLQAVSVRGEDVCRTSPDSGALVARAWEEARKAIMASQLSATDAPLVADWIEYNRTLDPTGRIVRGLRVRSTTNPTTHAFKSAPADQLATQGYVVPEGGETTYHAPDGDVLLSDSFASTHCFQIVEASKGADTLVGVGFRPARDRREVRDIEGTFWLDRRNAELRWMDYTYTNMPAVTEKASPGGRVEFLRVGTSGWLIGRWSIRMPEVGRVPVGSTPGVPRSVRPAAGALRAIQITGGQVTRVSRSDSVLYQASGAALDVQFRSADGPINAAGATVELVGTDYVAIARADGRARLVPVLEGRYEARIHTPLMDTLGVPPITREIEISSRSRIDTVQLASPGDLARAACTDAIAARGDSLSVLGGLVHGSVRDSTGKAMPYASVLITWTGRITGGGWGDQNVTVMTDANGRWRACGVPRGVAFVARVKTDAGTDVRRLRLEEDQALLSADLVPHLAARPTDIVLPKDNRALVELWAKDDEGALVQGVTFDVELPSGAIRSLTTGTSGHALIPNVEPGRITIRARKIGFKAGQLSVSVAAGRNTVPIIMSSAGLPSLDTVRIVGDERKRNDRLDDFETRRLNAAATRSITRAEIEKRNPVDAWQMMTNVPSMRIAQQGGLVIARSTRVENARVLSDRPCYMRAMVDGVLLPEDTPMAETPKGEKIFATNLSSLPPPDAIHGIEVFAGPASIPLLYGGTGSNKWCGLIAVWTR